MSRKHHSPLVNILLVLIALLTVADITVIGLCLKTPSSGNQKPGTSQNPTEGPDAPEETEPQETRPTPVSTATVTIKSPASAGSAYVENGNIPVINMSSVQSAATTPQSATCSLFFI